MASRTLVQLIDDVDGSEASQTVRFGLDGTLYEIDLNDEHADSLRAAFEKFVIAGRRTSSRLSSNKGGRVVRPGVPRPRVMAAAASTTKVESDNPTIRRWAEANGIDCPKRGRIPERVREAFDKAN